MAAADVNAMKLKADELTARAGVGKFYVDEERFSGGTRHAGECSVTRAAKAWKGELPGLAPACPGEGAARLQHAVSPPNTAKEVVKPLADGGGSAATWQGQPWRQDWNSGSWKSTSSPSTSWQDGSWSGTTSWNWRRNWSS